MQRDKKVLVIDYFYLNRYKDTRYKHNPLNFQSGNKKPRKNTIIVTNSSEQVQVKPYSFGTENS